MNRQKPTAISIVIALRQATSRAAVLITRVSMALLLVIAMHACSSEAPDTTPPAQVTDLRVEAFTETTAILIWTAPGDDGDRGLAAEYDLRMAVGAPPTDWLTATRADSTLPSPGKAGSADRASIRGLVSGQVYYFALRTADGDANWSTYSNVLRVEPGDPAPPARVTDLQALDPAPHSVTLVFTAPGDDSLSGWAQEYALRMADAPITEATWEQAEPIVLIDPPQTAGSQEHIRITALHPQTTAHLAIRARDDAGRWSDVSNDLEVTLPADTVPPGTIVNLALVETGIFTATLRWTAPGNDGDEAKVDGYEIRYAEHRIEDEAAWTAASVAPATVSIVDPGVMQTAVLTDLPGPKTLWFAVRATDLAGNRGAISNGVSGYVPRVPRAWVIRVDRSGEAPTVQAGIDSAAVGDTVLVMPGRYYENLNYNGKNIVVRSQAGPETTILDGSHKRGSVVVFRNGESRAAILEGFTITGGVGELQDGTTDAYRQGAGILAIFSEPVIRGNIISGNAASLHGGGVRTGPWEWSPLIEGNVMRNNRAGANGGGIGFGSSGVIENNVIEGNINDDGDGGGIWVWNGGQPATVVIRGNRIVGNEAGDHGGGIYVGLPVASQVEVGHNLIADNQALGHAHVEFSGGGIWLNGSSFWVHHNTIVGNDARGYPDASWGGGGIAVLSPGTKLIENNIIAYSTYGGGIRCESIATFELRNNLAWSNVGGDGNGSCADWTSTNGNLAADPLFCDQPGGDYSLAANSPALTHPAGPLGAFPTAGCGTMESRTLTWGRISTLYH